MKLEGGCYCHALRYVAEGEPMMKAQCHCRECQYITGGSPNVFIAMPIAGFRYTKGAPKKFARSDIPNPVTREFCAECGTHVVTRPQGFPAVIIKVGSLDDPKQFGNPTWRSSRSTSRVFIRSRRACRRSNACRGKRDRRFRRPTSRRRRAGPARSCTRRA